MSVNRRLDDICVTFIYLFTYLFKYLLNGLDRLQSQDKDVCLNTRPRVPHQSLSDFCRGEYTV